MSCLREDSMAMCGALVADRVQNVSKLRTANPTAIGTQARAGREDFVGRCIVGFPSISLDETNTLARMLSRIDNKYLVNGEKFTRFLNAVKNEFAVLKIDGVSRFTYSSCYYDDNYACYYDHHQGKRQRFKVRTREYVDTGARFFEMKFKGLRGVTEKHRTECDYMVADRIRDEHLDMLRELHQTQYRKKMPYALQPTLVVEYKRCTLVALQGGERVTVDYGLSFFQPQELDRPVRIGQDFIIVETKSSDGKGIADQAMKKLKIRKASNCSKYCIGVNLAGGVRKSNNFLTTLKHVRRNIDDPPCSADVTTRFECRQTVLRANVRDT